MPLFQSIFQARPEVIYVVHHHTKATEVLSTLRCKLLPTSHPGLVVHDCTGYIDCAYHHDEAFCQTVIETFADNVCVLMGNHGMMAVGRAPAPPMHSRTNRLRRPIMKITRIEAVPYSPPLRQFFGRSVKLGFGDLKDLEFGLVRVHTDDGVTGLGEISNVFAPTGGEQCRIVSNVLAPTLIGQEPARIAQAHVLMDQSIEGMEPAKAAIDMALYDIVGKSLNVPVHVLLGGQVRPHIDLSFSIMFGASQEMAALAGELAADGFKTLKVKVGQGAQHDEDAVRAIRATVGDEVTIRVDANMAWKTPKQALETLRRIEPFGIELAEQPLAASDLDGMAFIRERTDIPIMADESVWSPRTAMQVLHRQAADIVSVYVAEAGGLFRAAQIFSMCEAAGVPNAIGSMPETGVGTAAEVHLGVAMANLGVAADCCGSAYYDEDILTTPLKIEDGRAYAPSGPGLGVEIDEDIFKRWRKAD